MGIIMLVPVLDDVLKLKEKKYGKRLKMFARIQV
jgi:hypothetical protein